MAPPMVSASGNAPFRAMLEEAIGLERAQTALSALDSPASVSLRLNPFKPFPDNDGPTAMSGWGQTKEVPWSRYGRILDSRPSFTLDPLFHAGAYYVQDSSAMYVGHAFRSVLPGDMGRPIRVLDLCAAPGGKTTDLAASLREKYGDGFLLVANEVMRQRSGVLRDNVARWGDPNVAVTSADPALLGRLKGFFDIIVADVPCSGEGMFRKDAQALAQWSEDNVSLCEERQRRIVADVWPALSLGGTLLYSTCTFNSRENDGNVLWIAEKLGAEIITEDLPFDGPVRTRCGVSLVPGCVPGEGQYCAVLRKDGSPSGYRLRTPKTLSTVKLGESPFDTPMKLSDRGGMIIAEPLRICAELSELDFLHPVMTGTAVGELKGGKLVPHADLALCVKLRKDAFPIVGVDRDTALAFLHRDAIVLSGEEKGLKLICFQGLPLGFVKNLGNRCNSLLPQSRRIRMDI